MKHFKFEHAVIPAEIRAGEWFECSPPGAPWRHAWDITAANTLMRLAIARGQHQRIVRIPLNETNRQTFLNSGTEYDERHWRSDRCDPSVPILTVAMEGCDWIIDGWHRTRRAIEMDWPEQPAFPLHPHEDLRCRICPCCKPNHPMSRLVLAAWRLEGKGAC